MTAIANDVPLDMVAVGYLSRMAAQPVLAAKTLYMGQFVCAVTASGFMTDPDYATTGCVLGIAESGSKAVTGESSGDRGVNLLAGLVWRPNFATRPVVLTDIGKVCYASDNYTVSTTSTDGPVAGLVCGLDTTQGVLVLVTPALNYLLSQSTVSSNLASIVAGLGSALVGFDDSGNKTTAATVADCLDEIYLDLCSAKKKIRLPLTSFTKSDGTPLAKWSDATDGTAGLYSDGTKELGIRWNYTGAATDTVMTTFICPEDCDLTVAPTIKIKAAKVGATLGDAVTFVVGMYAQTEAALYDAGANLGVTTGAMTGNANTKTVQLVSGTLTVFPAVASGMTLSINTTAAKLATDDVIIFDAWVEYTSKPRTS